MSSKQVSVFPVASSRPLRVWFSAGAQPGDQDNANQIRIRDNQRRSRARRKEYLQELEQRLRECERRGVEASSEIQQAARRVLEENKRLRALLNDRGVADESIEAFLHAHRDSVASLIQTTLGTAEPSRSSSVHDLEQLLSPREQAFPALGSNVPTSQGMNDPLASHYPYTASQADAVSTYSYQGTPVTTSSGAMASGMPPSIGGYQGQVTDAQSQYYYNYASSGPSQASGLATTFAPVSYTPTYSSYTPTTASEYSYMEGEEGDEAEGASDPSYAQSDAAGSSQQYSGDRYWTKRERR